MMSNAALMFYPCLSTRRTVIKLITFRMPFKTKMNKASMRIIKQISKIEPKVYLRPECFR